MIVCCSTTQKSSGEKKNIDNDDDNIEMKGETVFIVQVRSILSGS